jgi:hypothetical protein
LLDLERVGERQTAALAEPPPGDPPHPRAASEAEGGARLDSEA